MSINRGEKISRPRKYRRICALPRCTRFGPEGRYFGESVEMTFDEHETVRLIDLEGLTQEQCAERMEVARTTVQAIYGTARKKLAECIVNGKVLAVGGGDVKICEYRDRCCGSCLWHCERLDRLPEKDVKAQ